MSSAILVALAAADTGAPACLLDCKGQPVIARLVAQLREHGASRISVLTRPQWRAGVAEAAPGCAVATVDGLADALEAVGDLAAKAPDSVLLAHADIVAHTGAIEGLLADPRVPSGVLSAMRMPAGTQCPRVRMVRGRIVEAESAFHTVARPTHAFLGLCKVSGADRDTLVEVARELRTLTADGLPVDWEPELSRKVGRWGATFYRQHTATGALAEQLARLPSRPSWTPAPEALREDLDQRFATAVLRPAAALREDPVSLCLVGLTRRDVVLTSTYLRNLLWARPLTQPDADEAAAALDAIDEDKVLLDSAVKAADGFFTTFFVSPYSKYWARWCARRGLTPNQVTTFSMLLGILAALAFAAGTRPWLVAGAVLLQLAFTTDCVDGQLARYTRQFSKLGAWLDSVFDRAKEYVVYAGLAWGYVAAGGDHTIWALAAAALTLQTFRHYVDFGFAAQQHQQLGKIAHAPLASPLDRSGKSAAHLDRERPLAEAVEDQQGTPGGRGLRHALGGQGVRLSARLEQWGWMRWAKRIIVLPIGERFALISVTAAVADARVTFLALLVWGAVAAAYTIAGRALRSMA